MQVFDEEHSKHVEVLLGYDKVLCEKASKAQVELSKIQIQQDCQKIKHMLETVTQ